MEEEAWREEKGKMIFFPLGNAMFYLSSKINLLQNIVTEWYHYNKILQTIFTLLYNFL